MLVAKFRSGLFFWWAALVHLYVTVLVYPPHSHSNRLQPELFFETRSLELDSEALLGAFSNVRVLTTVAQVYLKERMLSDIALRLGIDVVQPEHPQLAVVQGAVLKGLAAALPETQTLVKVKNRTARKHYGTELWTPYVAARHRELRGQRMWDGFDGCWRVPVMVWFIQKVKRCHTPLRAKAEQPSSRNKRRRASPSEG